VLPARVLDVLAGPVGVERERVPRLDGRQPAEFAGRVHLLVVVGDRERVERQLRIDGPAEPADSSGDRLPVGVLGDP
jgi:hypothetical protein